MSQPFAILRTAKLKTIANVAGSGNHNYRETPTPNANPRLTPKNFHGGASSTAELVEAVKGRLPSNFRKNAVVCIEYFIGMSPEAMKDKGFKPNDYFKDALKWLKNKHGAENVVAYSVHRDESTPHLVAYVVPLSKQLTRKPRGQERSEIAFEDKLNCRRFLGSRKLLSEMQTSFAEKVGKKHGLARGVEGSRAEHKTIKQWYGEQARARDTVPKVEGRDIPFSEKTIVSKSELSKVMELAGTANTQHSTIAKAEKDRADAKADAEKAKKQAEKLAKEAEAKALRASREAHQRILNMKNEFKSVEQGLRAKINEVAEANLKVTERNKELLKATANLLKSQPKPELARLMGVEMVGKADIFDAVVKAGKAQDYWGAVVVVAQAYNKQHETRISESAQWAMDYEKNEPKSGSSDFKM